MNIIGPYRPYTYRPYQRNMVQSLSKPNFRGDRMERIRQTSGAQLSRIREKINRETVPEDGDFKPCVVQFVINDAFGENCKNSILMLDLHYIEPHADVYKTPDNLTQKELTTTFINGRTGLTAVYNRIFKDREVLFNYIDDEIDIGKIVEEAKKETSGR